MTRSASGSSAEMEHAINHWRSQFRGEARVKNETDISDADIAAHNLVLWGDPSSNKMLAKIADKLPMHWNADGRAGRQADVHAGASRADPDLSQSAESRSNMSSSTAASRSASTTI